jgi:hypothetical protein
MSRLTLLVTRIVLIDDQREIQPAKSTSLIECMLCHEYKLKESFKERTHILLHETIQQKVTIDKWLNSSLTTNNKQ